MEQKDSLDKLFSDLNGKFDIELPNDGHEARFINRLQEKALKENPTPGVYAITWRRVISIAAAIVLSLSVFVIIQNNEEPMDLASVSPEMSKTQDFFTVTIESELTKLQSERSPLTEKIIDDALEQIQILETNYQNLKIDLSESGSDQRVIYAMISNFQNRIDILTNVLDQIETIKNLNNFSNETTNTI